MTHSHRQFVPLPMVSTVVAACMALVAACGGNTSAAEDSETLDAGALAADANVDDSAVESADGGMAQPAACLPACPQSPLPCTTTCGRPTWGTDCPYVPCNAGGMCLSDREATAVALAAEDDAIRAVGADGTVLSWDFNPVSEVGFDTVAGITNAVAVSGPCALSKDGTVACWSDGAAPAVAVADLSHVVAIASGGTRHCALLDSSEVRCWGKYSVWDSGVMVSSAVSSIPIAVPGLPQVSAIAANGETTCAGAIDGSVWCWGFWSGGAPRLEMAGVAGVAAVVIGEAHYCALTNVGSVLCWGLNDAGQLGTGSTEPTNAVVTVSGVSNAVAIAAGQRHSCALLSDGAVMCWGTNENYELGQEIPKPAGQPPLRVSALGPATGIVARKSYTCALGKDGVVRCWGSVPTNAIVWDNLPPNVMTSAASSGVLCGFGNPSVEDGQGPDGGATPGDGSPDPTGGMAVDIVPEHTVAVGGDYACAVNPDKTLSCWGGNQWKQASPPAGTFTSVVANNELDGTSPYACGIRTDGTIACWGKASPPPAGTFRSISGYEGHMCGIRTNGTVACWGDYVYSSLPSTGTFVTLSVGACHACAIRTDGTLACWGGVCFDGETASPTGTFVAVSAAKGVTCAVGSTGNAVCWGKTTLAPAGSFRDLRVASSYASSGYSWIGLRQDGSVDYDNGGAVVPSLSGTFDSIALGAFHACAKRTDGRVVCSGKNDLGQASPPGETFVSIATSLVDNNLNLCGLRSDGAVSCWGPRATGYESFRSGTFTAIALGVDFACGIRADGTLLCDGQYSFGVSAQPPQGTFTTIAAGVAHACAIRTTGQTVCWGANDKGQSTPPADVFVALGAGVTHTCGMRANGTVACWGSLAHADPAGTFATLVGASRACGLRPDGALDCWGPGSCQYMQHATEDPNLYCAGNSIATPPAVPFRTVSANVGSYCGVLMDGSVNCWGYGAQGDVCTAPSDDFTSLAVGAKLGFVCGIRAQDSQVKCWGSIAR